MLGYNELKVWLQKSAYKKYGKRKKHELQFSEEWSSSILYTFAFNSLCRANGSTHELVVINLE